jgi:hypothetical protein
MPDAELEAGRFTARQPAHRGDELHHLDRRGEGRVARRRNAIDTGRHTARSGDFRTDLRAGQHAAMARLGALVQLELDHFDLIALGACLEFFRAKRAVRIAAAEIARADFPNDVAAVFAVIGAIAALSRIVREISRFAPILSARMAFGLKAPKLIAEILKTEAE